LGVARGDARCWGRKARRIVRRALLGSDAPLAILASARRKRPNGEHRRARRPGTMGAARFGTMGVLVGCQQTKSGVNPLGTCGGLIGTFDCVCGTVVGNDRLLLVVLFGKAAFG